METVSEALEAVLARPSREPFLQQFGRPPIGLESINEWATRFQVMLKQRGLETGDLLLLKFSARAWHLFIAAYIGAHRAGVVPVLASAGGGTDQALEALQELPVRTAAAPSGENDFSLSMISERAGRAAEGVAEYLLTTGTTGRPKVVPVTHAARLVGRRGLAGTGRIVITIPPGSNAAQTVLAEALLGQGGLAVLERWSPHDFMKLAEESQARAALLAPAMAASLLREPDFEQGRLGQLKSLRLGMAPADRGLVESLATALPGTTISNIYTTTEAWPAGTVMRHSRDDPGSVGKPLPGTLIRVINGSTQEAATAARPGRIQLAYAPEPGEGPRWVETGDFGFLNPDGALVFVGRENEILTRGGKVVSLAEVERVILRSGRVTDVEAYAVTSPRGEELIAVAVVWLGEADDTELRRLVREGMGTEAIPAIIEAVPEIQRDAQGKLKRPQSGSAEKTVAVNDDRVLGVLSSIWTEIFAREIFDMGEDFFEIGGDSLAVILCNTLINEYLKIKLPLSVHYSAATLEELARVVRSKMEDG